MRLTSLDLVDSDAVLAKTLFDSSNRPLLHAGATLSSSILDRLSKIGYTAIYVKDALTYDIEVEDYVPPELKNQVIKEVRTVFKDVKDGNRLDRSISDKSARSLLDLFKEVLDSVNGDSLFELHMGSILNKDSELFEHCFNVALYTTIMATASGIKEDRVRTIGVGALLHDIGKIAVPESVLNKPGKLDAEEWEEIKKHTTMGYDIIRKQQAFSLISAHCAYQHHERLDGTGYPRGLKGSEIHEVGRISTIADVFDAMTAPRVYKDPLLPSDVLEYLYAYSGTYFDQNLIDVFRRNIALYPVGSPVTLSDHREGIVVKNYKENPTRPTIRIISDGYREVSPYDLDLSTTLNIVVLSTTKGTNLKTHLPAS